MMKISMAAAVACLAFAGLMAPAGAQPVPPPAVQTQAETAVIRVNGLICDFCVQTVKRMAAQRPEIARADVDLDQGRVTITFKPGQTLPDAALRTLITNAGYAVVGITRGRA